MTAECIRKGACWKKIQICNLLEEGWVVSTTRTQDMQTRCVWRQPFTWKLEKVRQ